MPSEVLIVDDGEISQDTRDLISDLLSQTDLSLKYFRKEKAGLAESRNLGARNAVGDVVLFLDDDVVLDKDYIENIIATWEIHKSDDKLAGVSGLAMNTKDKSCLEQIFDRVFCLYSPKAWAILPWGFQSWSYDLDKPEQVDWIPGYNCGFRKEVLSKYHFESLQPGRTALEDMEFCWKLKKNGYHFRITPFAQLLHKETLTGRERAFVSGYKEAFNRCSIFKIHSPKTLKNYICFSVASFGGIIRQWLAAFLEPSLALNHILYGLGLVKGMFVFLIGHA